MTRIVVITERISAPPITINRPRWKDVYAGYPKDSTEYDDLPTEQVFSPILGEDYDKKTFGDACATRVSLGLLNGKLNVRKDFLIQKGEFKGKGFIASAKRLKEWLSTKSVFGEADEILEGPNLTPTDLAIKLGERNGIYILIPYPGCYSYASGHATLWVGERGDVIGHSDIECAGKAYFWELK